jgi:glycosyltransferase involved in cell wall biosynthesis/SAM-dependent methyltransferase
VRANLLRPYQDSLKGDVLEIGAGCGAITRFLGEQGANVLALEGSPRRAAIARSRTRDLHNVTVLSEKFDLFKTDQTFDVITLIGVLEYANMFTPDDEPALTMLKRVRRLLKPEGRLIIAIENQLGLKYFAGAPEDHINVAMYGIEGRYRKDQPQTFGKKVLEEMLAEAGFPVSEFMAPFPDYKLPVSVVTEAGFKEKNFDAAAFAWQSARRDPQLPAYSNFSLELVWQEVCKNGLGLDMANSFLISASSRDDAVTNRDILGFHYSADRIPDYCKEAVFIKSGLHEVNVSYQSLAPRVNEQIKSDDIIHSAFPSQAPYISGHPLSWDFINLVSKEGWTFNDVGGFLRHYISILEGFLLGQEVSRQLLVPADLLPGSFFDAVPQNIIINKKGQPVLFDVEWSINQEISLGHLIFRSLLLMMGGITTFGKNSYGMELTRLQFIRGAFNACGHSVSEDELNQYLALEAKLQSCITGRSIDEFLTWHPQAYLPQLNLCEAKNDADHRYEQKNETLNSLLLSDSWRITAPIRSCVAKLKKIHKIPTAFSRLVTQKGGVFTLVKKVANVLKREGFVGVKSRLSLLLSGGTQSFDRNNYQKWIESFDLISDESRLAMISNEKCFAKRPLISIIMPVYNTNPDWLCEAIESVRDQIYSNWELCIADDCSTDPKIQATLDRYAKLDSRIKVSYRSENGHISKASNSALELATGSWVAHFDHDDLLAEHALYWAVDAINCNPQAALIYSDEDKIDESGNRFGPYFKCDWNVDLFYSHNLITHLGLYRKDIVDKIGGYRTGFEGAQDYDLALRFFEQISDDQIIHIPRILYHWRAHENSTAKKMDSKPYAVDAGRKAIQEHLNKKNIAATVKDVDHGYRVQYELPKVLPLVSLIIPTRNGLSFVKQCIESIVQKTSYSNYEIILVDNASDDPSALAYFEELKKNPKITVVRDERPFNYSALNNHAAKLANGEVLALINNDIEVISPNWLSELVAFAIQPQIGAVGAKLLYPSNQLQHAGVVMGIGGWAGHAHKGFSRGHPGYVGRASLISGFSAVTGACLVVRKQLYEMLGGLNETDLAIACNDVEFCLRLRDAGYRNVLTPYAELYHHESATRGHEDSPEKKARFARESVFVKRQWPGMFTHDPAYSPNLTLDYEDFSLAWPPRVVA